MKTEMKNFKYFRIIIFSLILIVAIYLAYRWSLKGYTWDRLWEIASETEIYAISIILGLFLIKTIFWVIPTKVLFAGASILFPTRYAILITYIGLAIEFTINYYAGKIVGKKKIMPIIRKSKHARWLIMKTETHSFFSCFIVRLFPGPPVDVTNMFFGSVGIRYIHYLFFSLLGLTPYILVIIFMGGAVENQNYNRFLIFLAIYLIVTLIFIFIQNKRKKKKASILKEETNESTS